MSKRTKPLDFIGGKSVGEFCLDLFMKHYHGDISFSVLEQKLDQALPITPSLFETPPLFPGRSLCTETQKEVATQITQYKAAA